MPHWHVLADALADLIIQHTDDPLREALSKIENELFELHNAGGPQASVRMDSMLSLRMEKDKMIQAWPGQVRDYSRNFGNAPVRLGELTLVTDAEMEANLAAISMGETLLKSQRPLFKALELQFEKILEKAELGEWEGIRHGAGVSEAPIHPIGLAQLACTWLAAWDCPDEDRVRAIRQVEKTLLDVLPQLLPAGLAVVEEKVNGTKPVIADAPINVGSTPPEAPTVLPDNVLPLMDSSANNQWRDALADAQEGLYDGGSDQLDLNAPPQHTQFTPEYSSLMNPGSTPVGQGAVNTPLYLDDLIRSRQERTHHAPLNTDVGLDAQDFLDQPPGTYLPHHEDFEAAPLNIGLNAAPPRQDQRGLASALMGLMNRFGSWRSGQAGTDSNISQTRGAMPLSGADILEQARRENLQAQAQAHSEAQRTQALKYTGKGNYDPTLDLAQIDESEFDPAMVELFSFLQARRDATMRQEAQHPDTILHVPKINPQDLGNALRTLQHHPDESILAAARSAGRGEGASLAHVLKESLIQHSRAAGAPQDGELEDADSDAADIVGMLFEIFLSERQISEEMRTRIATLVAPYVRVAVNDRKLFMQKTHPARRYLDTLAAAVDGNQGANFQERQMLNKAGSSIDHLTESFNEDLAIFDLADEEMRQYIEQRKAAMAQAEKRAADAQRGKERLDQAKLLADQAFERAIEECNWPVKTLEMLRGWWTQHHRMALLQDNPQTAVSESERLLLLLVKVGNQGVVSIGTEALRAHNDIINMLSSSGLTGQNAQNAASELWAALEQASIWTRLAAQGQLSNDDLAKTSTKESREAGRIALAAQTAPEFQDLSPDVDDEVVPQPDGIVHHKASTDTDDELPVPDYFSNNQELVDYFHNMSLGTWVDFVTPDRKLVATKLSWISPISNRLLFVTARGTKHAVESAENLAMMVKLDRVRLRRSGLGENGFDSSYRKALDVLAAQVGENPKNTTP